MANEANPSPHYSRMPGVQRASAAHQARATRTQSITEKVLFATFGGMLALGAIALYATGTASHNSVPSRFGPALSADRINVLVMVTEPQARFGRTVTAASAVSLLSIRPSTGDVALLGLPVELWADLGTHGRRPLGAAFEVGEAAGVPGGGDGLTIEAVERVTGAPVHAYVRVSLDQLADTVDHAGGLAVRVGRGVYDGRSRERFLRGAHRFDGRRAVIYGFSRDMAGFAADPALRDRRAQAVVAAAVAPLLRDAVRGRHLRTNLSPADAATLHQLVASSTVAEIDLLPHLLRTHKTTAVYDGVAFVPVHRSALRRVAAAALQPARASN